jgi:hypothetical protein
VTYSRRLFLQQKTIPCVAKDIFSTLVDKLSVDILTAAFSGLKSNSIGIINQTKKQY